jgi:hypothetical protein
VLSIVQLTAFSTRANAHARQISAATLLAADKLEELRAAPDYSASPPDALQRNAAGFCDFLDAAGRRLGPPNATTLPAGAVFLRRWSIRPAGGGLSDPITLEVLTVPDPFRAATIGSARLRGEARVAAIVTRKP